MKMKMLVSVAAVTMLSFSQASLAYGKDLIIGIGTDPSLAPFIVAVEKGFFKNYGVDASLAPYQNGSLSVQALLSGQADIGASGESTAIAPAAQGANLNILGSVYTSGKQVGLAVRPGIAGPGDLAGKKIGTVKNSVAEYYWQLYAAHWKIAGATVVPLPQADMAAAFARGDIDGYTVFEPSLSRGLEALSGSRILARSGDDGIYDLTAYILAGKRVSGDPELAKATIQALTKGVEFIKSNPDDAVSIVSKWIQLDAEPTKRIMNNINFAVQWSETDTKHIQDVAGWMLNQKLINKLPDWNKLLTLSTLAQTKPESYKGPAEFAGSK